MENEFTKEEEEMLSPYLSNLDDNVFVIRNLPEVVKGALFSRYSRSTKSLRRTLLEDFLESGITNPHGGEDADNPVKTEKAEKFYDRVLLQYGDDSVAELAGAHIALEDISIIATKIVEDARIGLMPLEKSTRYVYFDQKENGQYRYFRDPQLMNSEFSDEYVKTCDMLFDTYSQLISPLSDYYRERMPGDHGLSERALEATIRAKTCDTLRGLLPASTLTNMGFFGNGRGYEYLITKLYAEELSEMKDLASKMQRELRTTIPSFVKRPDSEHGIMMQEYIKEIRSGLEELASGIPVDDEAEMVRLVDYDPDAEAKVIASALYPYSGANLDNIRKHVSSMGEEEREKVIRAAIGDRKNRRHKPGRGFEHSYYTFEICTNFGAYRDLHRHRILTQQRQRLGCRLGYTMPPDLEDAGFAEKFRDAMDGAKSAWERISEKHPVEAQYVVPLAYNIRWEVKLNLRSAYHMCELRSARQGHIDYRRVAQKMYLEIMKVHSSLAKSMKYMDMDDYSFERLEAEKRIDKKLEKIGQ